MSLPNFFVSGHQTQKDPVYPHNFSVSFFLSLETHQSHQLYDAKQLALTLLLLRLFEPFVFDIFYSI